MGVAEIPSQSSDTIKIPTAQYEFGVNFMDPKVRLFSIRFLDDGINTVVLAAFVTTVFPDICLKRIILVLI